MVKSQLELELFRNNIMFYQARKENGKKMIRDQIDLQQLIGAVRQWPDEKPSSTLPHPFTTLKQIYTLSVWAETI